MANEQNLKPGEYKLTLEEQKRGGKKSVESRRKKKLMKEQIEMLLSLPIKDPKTIKLMEILGIDPENVDNQMALVIAMWQQAIKGGRNSVSAAEFLRDTVGEKPKDNMNVELSESQKLKDVFEQIGGEGLNE